MLISTILKSFVPLFALFVLHLGECNAGLLDEIHVAKAKQVCEEKGVLRSKGPVMAEGYLLSREAQRLHMEQFGGFSLQQVAEELLKKRFTYFEVEQSVWNGMLNGATGSGRKYFRFYLADRTSPECGAFERIVAEYPSLQLPPLRALGLPDTACVAIVKSDSLMSRYEKQAELKSERLAFGAREWTVKYSIVDRETATVISEVSHNGYDPGRRGHGFTCPNKEQLVAFEQTLQPLPDKRLAPPFLKTVVDDPAPFLETAELTAELLSATDTDRPIPNGAKGLALGPIALDGRISFLPRYKKESQGDFRLNGYYLVLVENGAVTKVHVKAFDNPFVQRFQALLVNEDEIAFFGHIDRRDSSKLDAAIFRYSRMGVPLARYKINMPDMAFRGGLPIRVEQFELTEREIKLVLIDQRLDGDMNARGLREYVLHASLPNRRLAQPIIPPDAAR